MRVAHFNRSTGRTEGERVKGMTGQEDLKVGDKIKCVSNEGLSSVGSEYEITALQGNFFSRSRNGRIWENRETFRWNCYRHLPQAIESDESAQAQAGGRIGGSHE